MFSLGSVTAAKLNNLKSLAQQDIEGNLYYNKCKKSIKNQSKTLHLEDYYVSL